MIRKLSNQNKTKRKSVAPIEKATSFFRSKSRNTRVINFNAVKAHMQKKHAHEENAIKGEKYSRCSTLDESRPRAGIMNLDSCLVRGEKDKEFPCQDNLALTKTKKGNLFGIFDGHGYYGHEVSMACAFYLEHKEIYFESALLKQFSVDAVGAMETMMTCLDFKVSKTMKKKAELSGSTSTLIYVEDLNVTVGWLGDSSAILLVSDNEHFEDIQPFFLTKRHDFSSAEEKDRIQEQGGEIRKDDHNILRLCDPSRKDLHPGLAMSKCLGDNVGKSLGASASPDTLSFNLGDSRTFGHLAEALNIPDFSEDLKEKDIKRATLLVASDGLWDVMTVEDVADFCRGYFELGVPVSAQLCKEAKSRAISTNAHHGYVDDISVICAPLL